MPSNYFAAGDGIVTKLKTIPGLQEVATAADVDRVMEGVVATPAAFVIYDGDEVAGDGRAAVVVQRWGVIIVAQGLDYTGARDGVGSLLMDVLLALQGFTPAEQHTQLSRVSGPPPRYYPGGFAQIPLMFTTRRPVVNSQ